MTTVDELRKAGAQKKGILVYIRENSVGDYEARVGKRETRVHNESAKVKGAPQAKPKAVKAKRKLITTLVQDDMEMTSKKMNLARNWISDEMQLVVEKLFSSDHSIVMFDSATLGVEVDESVSTSSATIQAKLSSLSNEKVFIPVNCAHNHWCSITLNLADKQAYIYDSNASSYLVSVRSVAQKIIALLPGTVGHGIRVRNFESGLGVQTDNYNCGIYVLIAFENFCGADQVGLLDKKTLQCMRYRYLRLCF
ncbi:cysteine protease family C48, putative [Phytophthora infestans T30-4]|uniref:Cysteine protease family C48, putative n=1 Tax=Phytophthora infestans (strain T30-4) TaxID=403677 RepID=D0N3I6_PHYIT|nr:cysteine protease family C48, putative [Phytophthora infestans T30-4]EEY68940.1 cysteine protease family C48, putative [Phytophthora infestans T30-4]|eukprot:XP_002998794.1 cysteine protease family C48, putative [Phytophthora infestans T30-4]